MEAKYVVACEVVKEVVWLKKFLFDLGVIRMEQVPIQGPKKSQEWKAHRKKVSYYSKHCGSRRCGSKIDSANNLADSFTKAFPKKTFKSHLEGMGIRLMCNSL